MKCCTKIEPCYHRIDWEAGNLLSNKFLQTHRTHRPLIDGDNCDEPTSSPKYHRPVRQVSSELSWDHYLAYFWEKPLHLVIGHPAVSFAAPETVLLLVLSMNEAFKILDAITHASDPWRNNHSKAGGRVVSHEPPNDNSTTDSGPSMNLWENELCLCLFSTNDWVLTACFHLTAGWWIEIVPEDD